MRGNGRSERRGFGNSRHPFSRLNFGSHGELGPLQSCRCHRRRYRLRRLRFLEEVSEEAAARTVGTKLPAMSDTRRRVKVYTLNEDRQWDDRGTGHVSSSYVEELKGMSLLVRAESDGSLLLESKINPNTAYQKQQASSCLSLI